MTSESVVGCTKIFLNPKSLNKLYTSSAKGVEIINVIFLIFSSNFASNLLNISSYKIFLFINCKL